MSNGLGRRIPTDFEHIDKYPLRAVVDATPAVVNYTMALPAWHWSHDQGSEGACVGFGGSMMKSIVDIRQAGGKVKRYNPWWLWNKAKQIDEWPETNPGDSDGTSVRASCEVMRIDGHVAATPTTIQPAYKPGIELIPGNPVHGIHTYRWATSVDQMRAAIKAGLPLSIGVNWYAGFDAPRPHNGEANYIFIGNSKLRGGHCVCVYGASDKRQAFRVKNSWGQSYPLVWLPYVTMDRLLKEYGEACIITDR